MHGLHINSFICHAQEAVKTHQGHDVLDFDLLLNESFFSQLFEPSLVELHGVVVLGESIVVEDDGIKVFLVAVAFLLVQVVQVSYSVEKLKYVVELNVDAQLKLFHRQIFNLFGFV